ncbi:hypothetical protein [Ramlibacter sp.]|uniref:hypothetical protein n=1 Tax=Ramlibacter sp. TaxID=1917967 RepID=UPI002CDA2112|nr:hypothetical protein [Ramlibacter sp.]HWI83009.1 hypothetical protein [Ramlibacter sp.]
MSERFWLWAAAGGFAAVILAVAAYAMVVSRQCERQGGVMVRSFAASGWTCVQPLAPAAPR